MKTETQYDLICAGGSLSCYLLAALSARSGMSVLVIDDEKSAATNEGAPTFGWGLDTSVLSAGIIQRLGVMFPKNRLIKTEKITQILCGSRRFTLEVDKDATEKSSRLAGMSKAEFERVLGAAYESRKTLNRLNDLALNLNQITDSEKKQVASVWSHFKDALSKNRPVPEPYNPETRIEDFNIIIASALIGHFSHAAPENISIEQLVRSLPIWVSGKYSVRGGLQGIKSDLSRIIRVHGGDILTGVRAENIVLNQNAINGVLLNTFEGIIRTKYLAIGKYHAAIYKKLEARQKDTHVVRDLDRVQPHSWKYTASYVVPKSRIPASAGSYMISIIDPEEIFIETNMVSIAIEDDMSDESRKVCNVTCLIPYRASTTEYDYVRRVHGKLRKHLEYVLPSVVGYIDDANQASDWKVEFHKKYIGNGPEWIKEEFIQYYVQGARGAQDFAGLPWMTNIKNLYFIGRQNWPVLGTYGEMIAAATVSEAIRSANMFKDREEGISV